jgi:predicted PurR-regulated permease PerM
MTMKEIELQKQPPPPVRRPGEWDQFTRQAAIVILLLAVLFLITVLRPLINLLGVTGIFILILSYPVNALRTRTKLKYQVAVIVVFIPIALLLLCLLGNTVGWFVDNTQSVVASVQQRLQQNQQGLVTVDNLLGATGYIPQWADNVIIYVGDQLSNIVALISIIAVSFFLAFLFILEMPANLQGSFRSLSDVSQHEFGILIDRLSDVWNGWLRSTVITSIIIGSTTALELFIFGIPYAGVLGVITGLLNLIPTFGPLISYLLIIFVTYTQGSSWLSLSPVALTLLVLIINMLINQVIRLVIFPRLAGKAVRLPVFLVILGLVVAAVLWGVVGVILVIPLLGTVREVLYYVLRKINRQDPYPGEAPHAGFWTQKISSAESPIKEEK